MWSWTTVRQCDMLWSGKSSFWTFAVNQVGLCSQIGTMCMGVKLGLSHWWKNTGWACLRTPCWRECFDLKGMKWEGRKKLHFGELRNLYSSPDINYGDQMNEEWMGWACSTHGKHWAYKFGWKTEREETGVRILMCIFRNYEVRCGLDSSGSGCGPLLGSCDGGEWTFFRFHKGCWIRWIAEPLSASQEGLCSM
jgi:hypothetical protein